MKLLVSKDTVIKRLQEDNERLHDKANNWKTELLLSNLLVIPCLEQYCSKNNLVISGIPDSV